MVVEVPHNTALLLIVSNGLLCNLRHSSLQLLQLPLTLTDVSKSNTLERFCLILKIYLELGLSVSVYIKFLGIQIVVVLILWFSVYSFPFFP